jgi:Zn-dependent peptidase ImmA (M78 family)
MRDGKKVIIGVNADNQWERQRFTVAHELGHFVLHDDNLRVDHHFVDASREPRLRVAAFRDRVSSQATDAREIEANRFAAALLMPIDFLEKSLRAARSPLDNEAVATLATKYEVSIQAMTYRLMNLGAPIDYAGQR